VNNLHETVIGYLPGVICVFLVSWLIGWTVLVVVFDKERRDKECRDKECRENTTDNNS